VDATGRDPHNRCMHGTMRVPNGSRLPGHSFDATHPDAPRALKPEREQPMTIPPDADQVPPGTRE